VLRKVAVANTTSQQGESIAKTSLSEHPGASQQIPPLDRTNPGLEPTNWSTARSKAEVKKLEGRLLIFNGRCRLGAMHYRDYTATRPLAVLHQGQSRWYQPLLTASLHHNLPLFVYASQPGINLEAALAGLQPLNFRGAVVEDPGMQAMVLDAVQNLEAEAERARRVDLVVPEVTGTRGFYLEPIALANLIRRYAFSDKALWLGPVRSELAQGLRGLTKVSVLSRSFPEGESFLELLPVPQRGVVAVAEVQATVVARQADLIVYTGGSLPVALLQPYHNVIALKPLPAEALRLVGQYVAPEVFQKFHLAALLEPMGYTLPPEAFTV